MPFVKRVVTPFYVSRSNNSENDNSGNKNVLTRDNSELIAVNNCTLSNAIRQLASLAGHAEEIFRELRQELGEVNARATKLKQRITNLEEVAEHFDARTVTVPESDLDSFYRRTQHFVAKHEITTGLFSSATRTLAVRRLYDAAGVTPVPAIRELDRLRRDGKRSSRIFMCTPILGGTGPRRKKRIQLAEIETSKPASLTSLRPWKSSEVLGESVVAPDVSTAPPIDTTVLSDSDAHQLPSPEEQWSAVARRFPGQLVVVDVSGRNFDRQQRNRRSLSQVDARRAERHRKRRSRRRNTIAGTSEAELIRQAADGESQPGSGDAESPEVESSLHSLSSKRKIGLSDNSLGERVMSQLNNLKEWGRQRLSRSTTRSTKDEANIYESVRSGRRRSQSSSPHSVAVRLRSNSARKKEDTATHSSSGNWSASSSARTSVESDQHRGSSCPPSTSSQATCSIPVSSSSSNSLGRDSAVSIRRPKALSISSSISRTSESGTLTPELLLPHDIPFADSISSSCNDGETSSVYSCDTEGYYTSFHMDSGLKTLREEPTESSSNTANNTNSSGNITVCAQIVTRALTAENEYELFGKGSTSTTTSSAGTVCTTLLAPGKPSPPPRKSSLEHVASTKSDSNSDTDTIERRARVKTALSSSRIPSMCVITPPASDDEGMLRPSSQLSFHTLPRAGDKSSQMPITFSSSPVETTPVLKLSPTSNLPRTDVSSHVDGDYVTISDAHKQATRIRETEYISLNELPCNQAQRATSPADSGSGSSGSTKSPRNSLERRRRQGARVTLDSDGKVVYSSDSLKRKPKTSNTTFEPGPFVKADPSPSPLPVRATSVRPVVRQQSNSSDSSPLISPTSPPMSPNSHRVIIRATGNRENLPPQQQQPRAMVRASSGPTSPKSIHPGAYVDMQASEKKALQGKGSNVAPAPIISAQTQEKQERADNVNFIDPSSPELNKIKRNESYRLAANFSPVLQAKQPQGHNGEVSNKQQFKTPLKRIEEKTQHPILNPNILGRRFYGAQIMVDPSKILSSNSKVSTRLQNDIQQQLLATQIAASSPKSRVTIPSDTEKARVLNSGMLPSSPLAGPHIPHRFYSMPRAPSYQATSTAIPQHNRATSPPAARDPTSPMYDASYSRAASSQYFSTASSPPPPAPYYWTLPSRRATMEAPAQQVQQCAAPQPSWYHTIASHNNPASPPYSPHRHLDTNHNVLQNQMFSTPTKNHVPQMPYCTYSPIGSPKKNLDRSCSSASPLASPSRAQSPNKPLMSPPKSTMSAEELFAAIHRSKRRMNIKSADDFSRSTSPTTSSASLSPGSSESSLGAVGNRHSWSPGTNDILPDLTKSKEQGSPVRGQAGQRQSWAGDRLGPVQPTSRNVFKRLLLEKGSRSEGKGRISAVEQLMASKAVVSKPKEQKVTLPAMPSGLRSPASWRFNSPRSDVLSSTILEDTEDASSESPTHSPSSLQQRMSPRHNAIYASKAPVSSPKTTRYNLTPAQASDFAARSTDYQKYLKYDVDRLAPSSKEIPSYSNISPFKNAPLNHHDNASPQSLIPQDKSSPSRLNALLNKSENQRQNNIVTCQTPPSPSKLSLETAL